MQIVKLHAIPSTNDYLRQLSQNKKLEDWTIVTAEKQEKGKGQRGNVWHSAAGKNVTLSIYRDQLRGLSHVAMLHRYVSVGIIIFLRDTFGISAAIKWPNDILSGNRKIAGILIENNFKGGKIASSVIGIGLNLNQESFPEELNATSTKILTGQYKPVDEAVIHLVQCLKDSFRESEKTIRDQYRKLLFGLDQKRNFLVDGHQISGTVRGVTVENQLVVDVDGTTHLYDVQEIKWLL